MTSRYGLLIAILALGLACSGCAAGPGHTRAAGAVGGTAAGALIGGAVADSPEGALLGGLLGYMVGATAGEGIAQDQERYNNPPFRRCGQPCAPCGQCGCNPCANCGQCNQCSPCACCRRPCRPRARVIVGGYYGPRPYAYGPCGP